MVMQLPQQTCKETQDIGALTKAADFVKAFILGFQVEVSNRHSSTFHTYCVVYALSSREFLE